MSDNIAELVARLEDGEVGYRPHVVGKMLAEAAQAITRIAGELRQVEAENEAERIANAQLFDRAYAAEVERDRLKEALKRIDTAFDNATRGKGNPERDLGWTGSSDNWGQILSWFAREALRGETK